MSALPHKPGLFDVCGVRSKPEDPALVISTVKYYLRRMGREVKIDILINNPGVGVVDKKLGKITAEEFGKVFDASVRGMLLMTQEVLPLMGEGDRIVNILSTTFEAASGSARRGLS